MDVMFVEKTLERVRKKCQKTIEYNINERTEKLEYVFSSSRFFIFPNSAETSCISHVFF